jgi:hypothetical protein
MTTPFNFSVGYVPKQGNCFSSKRKTKEGNASMNMLLVMTTKSKTPYEAVFKDKELIKNKTFID